MVENDWSNSNTNPIRPSCRLSPTLDGEYSPSGVSRLVHRHVRQSGVLDKKWHRWSNPNVPRRICHCRKGDCPPKPNRGGPHRQFPPFPAIECPFWNPYTWLGRVLVDLSCYCSPREPSRGVPFFARYRVDLYCHRSLDGGLGCLQRWLVLVPPNDEESYSSRLVARVCTIVDATWGRVRTDARRPSGRPRDLHPHSHDGHRIRTEDRPRGLLVP
mmetsp:Transcript_16069/g.33237  ORF Transcript_16069/g.33237 Transcript_16069/m.33237 type:complete len:215 (-) Transcript_16069:853-1497(-)